MYFFIEDESIVVVVAVLRSHKDASVILKAGRIQLCQGCTRQHGKGDEKDGNAHLNESEFGYIFVAYPVLGISSVRRTKPLGDIRQALRLGKVASEACCLDSPSRKSRSSSFTFPVRTGMT